VKSLVVRTSAPGEKPQAKPGVFTWHLSQAYMASKGVTAGPILYPQAWGRDQGFAAPNNSKLSDAIVFQVAP
jgi:hypothetical protein